MAVRPQAEQAQQALFKAVEEGHLTTLGRLVAEGVNVNAVDEVSAAPPQPPPASLLRPSPSALAAYRPLLPRPHRRRSPRLRRTAGRPS